MAVHGMPPLVHNKILEVRYRWGGNPFISNNYFRTLASRPQYNLHGGIGLGLLPLVGDAYGRPLRRELQGDFTLQMKNWWNTSHPDSGPWFFRPMTVNGETDLDEALQPRWPCFEYNSTAGLYERPWYAHDASCDSATINQETGVQTGGPAQKYPQMMSFAFYLPYEASFVKNFTIDAENHPRGCNIPEVFPESAPGDIAMETPVNCGRSSFKLDGEDQSSADIVEEFADDHEVWADTFIKGWQVLSVRGFF